MNLYGSLVTNHVPASPLRCSLPCNEVLSIPDYLSIVFLSSNHCTWHTHIHTHTHTHTCYVYQRYRPAPPEASSRARSSVCTARPHSTYIPRPTSVRSIPSRIQLLTLFLQYFCIHLFQKPTNYYKYTTFDHSVIISTIRVLTHHHK